jgi:heme/copper-type cytochrome/quinol oxidase subunit 3
MISSSSLKRSLRVTQKHPFHIVDPSPWPLVGATAAFIITSGTVAWIHNLASGQSLMSFGFLLLLVTMWGWFRDIIREGTFEGQHTSYVQVGLRIGMLIFIGSEVMFFVAFFWAFFWAALSPSTEIGSVWPPFGIDVLSAWEVPLLNTVLLLTSGAYVTWSHHAIVSGDMQGSRDGLIGTILLATRFTWLQYVEYCSSGFTIADSVFGSTFFIATGFHGAHVIIGTVFLAVCRVRIMKYHFTTRHHFGFEAAAWYWHFVDVVWLFLFVAIYAWGGL